MKNPSTFLVKVSKHKGKERFGTGPLKMEPRLLAYVIAWIITHRVRNHAQLTEEDLFNWVLNPLTEVIMGRKQKLGTVKKKWLWYGIDRCCVAARFEFFSHLKPLTVTHF